LREVENPYLDRKEIEVKILHEGEATPKRVEVFKSVVERLSLDIDKTILISLETIRGTNTSVALIYYYPNGIDWSTIEPVKRNKVIQVGEEKPEEKGEEA
jgi:ribosomal protein S24E